MIIIKDEPELRHVLAHLLDAVIMAAKGDEVASLYELKSIEGLVLFNDDDDFRRYVNERLQEQKETSET